MNSRPNKSTEEHKILTRKIGLCLESTMDTADYNSSEQLDRVLYAQVFDCVALVVKHKDKVCLAHIYKLDIITDEQFYKSLSKIKEFVTNKDSDKLDKATSIRLFGGQDDINSDYFFKLCKSKIENFFKNDEVEVKYDPRSKNTNNRGTMIIIDKEGTAVSKNLILNGRPTTESFSPNQEIFLKKCKKIKEYNQSVETLEKTMHTDALSRKDAINSKLKLLNIKGDCNDGGMLYKIHQNPHAAAELAKTYGPLRTIDEILHSEELSDELSRIDY